MTQQKDAYAKAGVDIDAATRFVEMIKNRIAKAWPGAERNIGGFAGAVNVPQKIKKMIASTDGVGTKLILAAIVDDFSGVGIDAVAMSAVDSYVAGIRPKYLLDYFATGMLLPDKHISIMDSLIRGCLQAKCQIVGGETAEMPRFFRHDWYVDLVTFVVGFDDAPIRFSPIKVGQRVFALPSYGLASNGFSLVRKAHGLNCSPSRARKILNSSTALGKPLYEILLSPTPIWISQLDDELDRGVKLSGMIHVTGGGLVDNPPRILPSNKKMIIDRGAWKRPAVFGDIQDRQKIPIADMDRAFNNGVMMLLVLDEDSPALSSDIKHYEVGIIAQRKSNESQVELSGKYDD